MSVIESFLKELKDKLVVYGTLEYTIKKHGVAIIFKDTTNTEIYHKFFFVNLDTPIEPETDIQLSNSFTDYLRSELRVLCSKLNIPKIPFIIKLPDTELNRRIMDVYSFNWYDDQTSSRLFETPLRVIGQGFIDFNTKLDDIYFYKGEPLWEVLTPAGYVWYIPTKLCVQLSKTVFYEPLLPNDSRLLRDRCFVSRFYRGDRSWLLDYEHKNNLKYLEHI